MNSKSKFIKVYIGMVYYSTDLYEFKEWCNSCIKESDWFIQSFWGLLYSADQLDKNDSFSYWVDLNRIADDCELQETWAYFKNKEDAIAFKLKFNL